MNIKTFDEIKEELESKLKECNLVLNENEGTVRDVANYILDSNDDKNEYTVDEWIKDTTDNYPECFENYKRKLFCLICNEEKNEEDVSARVVKTYDNCEVIIDGNSLKLEATEKPDEDSEIICNKCDGRIMFETQETINDYA